MLTPFIHQLQDRASVDLVVRVRPRASKTKYVDILADGSIKVDIAAPAEDNRGNAALIKFLARVFNVPAASIEILAGKTGRQKLVRIRRV